MNYPYGVAELMNCCHGVGDTVHRCIVAPVNHSVVFDDLMNYCDGVCNLMNCCDCVGNLMYYFDGVADHMNY